MDIPQIGTLISAKGRKFTIRLLSDDEGFEPVISNGDNSMLTGQIGTHISLQQTGVHVIASVIANWQEEDDDGSITRYIECHPIGELLSENDFSRGVNQFPTAGAKVFPVCKDELKSLYVNNEKYDFYLGHLRRHPEVNAYINPNPLFGRHLAILGQSGSGKSWTVAQLIQSTLRTMSNAHIILLDLHGEYCWKGEDNKLKAAFENDVMRYVDARDLEIPYWLLTYSELIDLLIDREDPGASTQIAYLREVLLVLRKKANTHLDIQRLSVDSPVYFSLTELYMHFKKANEQQTDFGKTKGAL